MTIFAIIIAFSIFFEISGKELSRRGVDCKGSVNNCQRGVGGTAGLWPRLRSRLADCFFLNRVIVTPSPGTNIVTETVTSGTIFVPPFLTGGDKRIVEAEATPSGGLMTIFPSSLPTYATYCPDAAKYFSACGCAGVTLVTTTGPTPTVTLTTTEVLETCSAPQKVQRGLEVMNGWLNTGLA
ncbi:hypothetical protein GQ607_017251 [Colletotrichum asianum]|uniref:Uncharacterized protein n=1 Tax=Colletotrichum asianum TaxID=702518 RepID=A0A8H3VS65_9PEZI|nr:hypothetical protein GQ607_017251 [Colletotrichum asianum]